MARSQVRLLDNNRLVASDLHVEGRDSNALLEDIFGVPARPEAFSTAALRRVARQHRIVAGETAPEHAEFVRYHVLRKLRQRGEAE